MFFTVFFIILQQVMIIYCLINLKNHKNIKSYLLHNHYDSIRSSWICTSSYGYVWQ